MREVTEPWTSDTTWFGPEFINLSAQKTGRINAVILDRPGASPLALFRQSRGKPGEMNAFRPWVNGAAFTPRSWQLRLRNFITKDKHQ